MAAISAGAWVGMTEKAPDESGVHFDRLEVAGDIPSPSGGSSAVSSRWTWIPDRVRNDGKRPDCGLGQVTVKPGMTEKGRMNPGIAATSRSLGDNLSPLCRSGPWPRLVPAHGLE
jgi:hypothetical protein